MGSVRLDSRLEENMTATATKRWYVVHAYSGFEKSVARALEDRINRAGMTDKFGKILVPVEEVVEMKGGQKHMSERKFFPGYVLVEMEMNDDTWHLVKNTNKVTGFVGGTATKPAPIPEKEVEAIMQQMREGVEKPKPKVLFEVGEMVRVKDGPFTDFQGTVEDVNYEKSRLRVAVTIFGRSTPVELEFGQVEKAYSRGEAASRAGTRRGERQDKEDGRLDQVAGPRRQGKPVAAHRAGARPARPQHHGVLQGVQRADAEGGAGPAAAGGDHRLRGQELLVHHQDAADHGADQEGRRHRIGQPASAHRQGGQDHAQAGRGDRQAEAARPQRRRSRSGDAHRRGQRPFDGRDRGGHVMPHISKRRKVFISKVDPKKTYAAAEALKLVKETATAKFDEAIDVAVNLGID